MPDLPAPSAGGAPVPGIVLDLDLADGVEAIGPGDASRWLLVLVRLFGEPIGALARSVPQSGLAAEDLAATVAADLADQLRPRLAACGISWIGELAPQALRPPRTPPFLEGRARAVASGPPITVAVCTRDRPVGLRRLLANLRAQHYPRLKILVVDSAPSDDRARSIVDALGAEPGLPLRYVREQRPGLSVARNRAIAEVDEEILAWADDDEICDPWWATEIARAFVDIPEAGAVTGLVMPAELATESQVHFERYSGILRGRGFERQVFSAATASQQHPMYPLPPFGVGANMAFRTDALRALGGFDEALGAGTATKGGEETAMFAELLLAGGTIVYQPSAIVHHTHRRDNASLRALMRGYGRGLGAFYASMIMRRPSRLATLARLARRAVRDQFSGEGQKLSALEDFPSDLLRANRVGLLEGPILYLAVRARQRLGRG